MLLYAKQAKSINVVLKALRNKYRESTLQLITKAHLFQRQQLAIFR